MDICISGIKAINLKEIIIALNDLLTAIYGVETRLSDLLINIGFDNQKRFKYKLLSNLPNTSQTKKRPLSESAF